MLTVVAHRLIPACHEETWRLLTEAPLVSEWLAAVERIGPHEAFRFDFGDGDFYLGRMGEWYRPLSIAFKAAFMGVAPEFNIDLALKPLGRETFVTVRDRGATTVDHAESVRQRWEESLGRLEARAKTGVAARCPWRDTITLVAVIRMAAADLLQHMRDPRWWRTSFPDATIAIDSPDPHALVAMMNHATWNGRTTVATLQMTPLGQETRIDIVHIGWKDLPEHLRLDERRRYARQWAGALQRLEEAGAVGHPLTSV